ncbi:MAG TPA: phosphatase PAP2 family protein [Gemmatimonadaceae bacterium]|nr:phosphatase PAP2 family protein [Gemmatimonadaceae bacterium]
MTTPPPPRRRRPAAPWLFLAIGVTGLALVMLYLGPQAFGARTEPLDRYVRAWAMGTESRLLERFGRLLTNAGTPVVLYVLGGLAALLLLWRRGWRAAVAMATAPLLALTLHNLAKDHFERARPPGGVVHESTSFPSGHATSSAAVLVSLAYTLWRERLLPPAAAVLLGVAGPLLIAWSRIRVDAHWATDVIAGWSLGLIVAGVCGVVHRRLVKGG